MIRVWSCNEPFIWIRHCGYAIEKIFTSTNMVISTSVDVAELSGNRGD